MSSFPPVVTTYAIAAYKDNETTPQWIRKSGRNGCGVWTTCHDWRYAERMFDKTRAKNVLKAVGVKRLEAKGFRFVVVEVTASYQIQRVWPLAPLEALAQVAKG